MSHCPSWLVTVLAFPKESSKISPPSLHHPSFSFLPCVPPLPSCSPSSPQPWRIKFSPVHPQLTGWTNTGEQTYRLFFLSTALASTQANSQSNGILAQSE